MPGLRVRRPDGGVCSTLPRIFVIVADDGFKVAWLLVRFQTLSSVRRKLHVERGEKSPRRRSVGSMWAEFRVIVVLEFVPALGDFFQGFLVYFLVAGLGHGDTISRTDGVDLGAAVRTYASRIFRLAVLERTWFADVGVAWLLSEGILCPVFRLRGNAQVYSRRFRCYLSIGT